VGGAASSPWAFHDQETVSEYSSTTTLANSAISVTSGDLVVVTCTTGVGSVYCNGITDTAGNTYTVRSAIVQGQSTVVTAYTINATGNAANVITASFAGGVTSARKVLSASSYTPGVGKTVTLDTNASGASSYTATPWQTGTVTTTGTDEVCVMSFQSVLNTINISAPEIPVSSAATGFTQIADQEHSITAYRILTDTFTNGRASVTASTSQAFSGEVLCFKATL
jgi:hypothetical protein